MLAYHGNEQIKAEILAQLEEHRLADQIVKGQYWEDGKGCAVGCTIHSGNHAEYETRFGIPQMLARLEDTIFEGLPNDDAQKWPLRFMSAIKPGADLSLVGWKFLHWLLTDETVNPSINHPLVRDAVRQCTDTISPLIKGELINESTAACAAASAAASAESTAACAAESAAACAAESAAACAASAAWIAAACAAESTPLSAKSAAWIAESAAASAALSAKSAAWSAALSAKSAAWSAESAALSAESAAESAALSAAWSAALSAKSAAWSAESAAYQKMAEKLIDLLESA